MIKMYQQHTRMPDTDTKIWEIKVTRFNSKGFRNENVHLGLIEAASLMVVTF